jgi:hypothetical protein
MRIRIDFQVREDTDRQGCSLKSEKHQGCPARSYRLKEISINHNLKPFSLHKGRFTLFNAELNNKQLMECTQLKRLMLIPRRSEINKL